MIIIAYEATKGAITMFSHRIQAIVFEDLSAKGTEGGTVPYFIESVFIKISHDKITTTTWQDRPVHSNSSMIPRSVAR